MSSEPWTIESIRDALADPDLVQRFLSEINRAPAHQLLTVFAKWERIAKDTLAAVQRGRELAAYEARGEQPPGEWIDVTDRVLDEARRIRARGTARPEHVARTEGTS
ncbi:hypothetical protein [Streptomyces sp. NPDC017529]|uniref:hypothetical protein n=1 Tax=Streptomyces sp. NPDC017529 TaxID=3365000 RepID=UPI0037BDAEAB